MNLLRKFYFMRAAARSKRVEMQLFRQDEAQRTNVLCAWGCRKTNVFRAASRSKPRFRSNAEEKPRPPDTFFLPLYKNRGTRPRFLWICCANSILCVLSHEAQNRNLTFSTSWNRLKRRLIDTIWHTCYNQGANGENWYLRIHKEITAP